MADEQETRGTVDKATGKAKEAWGNVTGDEDTKREGQMQQLKGDARKTAGTARRNAQEVGDRLGDTADDARDTLRDKQQDSDQH